MSSTFLFGSGGSRRLTSHRPPRSSSSAAPAPITSTASLSAAWKSFGVFTS